MIILNYFQLEKLAQAIGHFGEGAQLQEILMTEHYLFLQHYKRGPFTIGIELSPLKPNMAYFFEEMPKRKGLLKPIIFFLRAHLQNLKLVTVETSSEIGRVLRLCYASSERTGSIEIRLIPHGLNIIIEAMGKKISLHPVRSLPPSVNSFRETEVEFDLEGYLDQWMERLRNPATKSLMKSPAENALQVRVKELQKKKTLLAKLENDLKNLIKPWAALGEYLKGARFQVDSQEPFLDVPDDWKVLLDPSLPLNANMQRCFERQKIQDKRAHQIQTRILEIQTEIQHLEEGKEALPNPFERPIKSLASELLVKAKAKGRKLILAEGVEAVFGKSAKDNLALLRKAQPWDLWVHLKDLPGAHLILRRPRNRNVDHSLLLEASRWLLRETLGKQKIIEGDRYEVVVTECRFVKPIKGDRIGRVTFQNETTLILRL